MRREFKALAGMMAALIAPLGMAQGVRVAEGEDHLANAKWNRRILAICTQANANPDESIVAAQYYAADWAGYLERDLMLVWVTPDNAMSWTPRPSLRKEATLEIRTHNPEKTGLAERIGCGPDFDFVALVGKDGGVKQRWPNHVETDILFELIDAMPMRPSEMRRSH